DFGLFIATALATLFMGIEEGIGTGVVLSLIMVVYRSSFPHIAELGQIPDSTQYRNVKRFDDLIDRNDTIILRIDARLYFANLNFIKETIYAKLANKKGARYLILDASAISGIDSSSVHMLRELQEDLKKRNISIHFVDVKGPIRDILKKNELLTEKGPFSYALTIDDAVKQIAEKGRLDFNVPYVFESQN
ncbi:MAG: STAS domain-containing protein, partial [Saprospiraceae bacterium]|nr:STAS domain-containing protein [Saprospiraceae bacterium]